jgi:hypothetical protein
MRVGQKAVCPVLFPNSRTHKLIAAVNLSPLAPPRPGQGRRIFAMQRTCLRHVDISSK